MIDVLAPLALVGMVLLVVAAGVAARRQRRERAELFRDLARGAGWRYLEVDDGTAEALSRGFRDFARFRSPSIGATPPTSVVLGRVDEGRVCLFSHATRRHEGDARQWTVCLLERPDGDGPQVRVRPRGRLAVREVGGDPEVSVGDVRFDRAFEVRSPDPEAARDALDGRVRELLLARAGQHPFPVEVQLRDRRVAAYPARRNDAPESTEELAALVSFTREVARSVGAGAD